MRSHNICFCAELTNIIPNYYQILPLIWSSVKYWNTLKWKDTLSEEATLPFSILPPLATGVNLLLQEQILNFHSGYLQCIRRDMDRWMICDFGSFSTVFQSYQDDERLIMKGCAQRYFVYGWEDYMLSLSVLMTARSAGQSLTHWATGASREGGSGGDWVQVVISFCYSICKTLNLNERTCILVQD